MKKSLTIGTVALFLALSTPPLMAGENSEHSGHQPAKTEHAHGQSQTVPAKDDTGSHGDQMEKKMAKMSIKMEKMKRELADAEERLTAMKGVLDKAQKSPPGADRNKLLTEHGAGLRTLLAGFRARTEEMMGQMEQMMGKEKKGGMMGDMGHAGNQKEHGSGSGMMDQEMMDDMTGHHDVMNKRLALLTELMGQMEAHLAAMSAPQ
ncbi:MAG: hypothetical protein HQM04_09525 [Magnetococcales bacterium]|nr:hypothetical protein [Magnetococcales bacterium]MBF0115271.1 hypothetical protein [Magnetococcales bacterium]